jgi:hypothetical protein
MVLLGAELLHHALHLFRLGAMDRLQTLVQSCGRTRSRAADASGSKVLYRRTRPHRLFQPPNDRSEPFAVRFDDRCLDDVLCVGMVAVGLGQVHIQGKDLGRRSRRPSLLARGTYEVGDGDGLELQTLAIEDEHDDVPDQAERRLRAEVPGELEIRMSTSKAA